MGTFVERRKEVLQVAHQMLGEVLVHRTVEGLEGLAIMVTEWENGCVRVTIQPSRLQKDGALQNHVTYDEADFEFTGKPAPFQVPDQEFAFKIGDIVRDGYNQDFTGRVIALSMTIVGVPTVGIRPTKLTPDGEPPAHIFLQQPLIELCQDSERKEWKPSGGPRSGEPSLVRQQDR